MKRERKARKQNEKKRKEKKAKIALKCVMSEIYICICVYVRNSYRV